MGRQLRQLLLLAAAFFVGVFAALALGAINLGTALGVGQVCFAAMLVYVLMADRSSRSPDDGA
ncbi:MAG TPA: hypothetical protein VHV53_10595 [Solirubrobacterales bacterium]|jgi:uncharacterized membrane protein (DUF485 family)|nr:hypothetical protein [Solirubrobacterales bacterium]